MTPTAHCPTWKRPNWACGSVPRRADTVSQDRTESASPGDGQAELWLAALCVLHKATVAPASAGLARPRLGAGQPCSRRSARRARASCARSAVAGTRLRGAAGAGHAAGPVGAAARRITAVGRRPSRRCATGAGPGKHSPAHSTGTWQRRPGSPPASLTDRTGTTRTWRQSWHSRVQPSAWPVTSRTLPLFSSTGGSVVDDPATGRGAVAGRAQRTAEGAPGDR